MKVRENQREMPSEDCLRGRLQKTKGFIVKIMDLNCGQINQQKEPGTAVCPSEVDVSD